MTSYDKFLIWYEFENVELSDEAMEFIHDHLCEIDKGVLVPTIWCWRDMPDRPIALQALSKFEKELRDGLFFDTR